MKDQTKKTKNKVNKNSEKQRHETKTKQYGPNYWKALYKAYLDLNRVLQWGDTAIYEARQYYENLSNEDWLNEEEYLVREFEAWAQSVDDGLTLSRVLELNPRTQAWLKKKCRNWDHWLKKAQDALLISDTAEGQINYRLGELAFEVLTNNFPALYEGIEAGFDDDSDFNNVKTAFKIFFREEFPYTEQDARFVKIRKEAIKRKRKELDEEYRYLDQLEPTKKKQFPWKWITNDQGIMANLNRKGNRYFLKIYEMLMAQRIRFSELSQYTHLDPVGDANMGKADPPVLVKPNFELIKRETGCDDNTIRRYLREMNHQGILIRAGKDGERGQMIYQIGEWAQGRAAFPKPVWFLKNTKETREALKDFDTNRPLKTSGSQK